MTRTLDQRRAAMAAERVNGAITELSTEAARRYRAAARSFPMKMRTNGLGQAIALEMSGAGAGGPTGEGHKRLLSDLLAWLGGGENAWDDTPYPLSHQGDTPVHRGQALLKRLVRQDEADLLRAQFEMALYCRWLKTFAEALIEPEQEAAEDQSEGIGT